MEIHVFGCYVGVVVGTSGAVCGGEKHLVGDVDGGFGFPGELGGDGSEVGADGDLALTGESIRGFSAEVLESLVAASQARLRAMNWLCGLGDWDDPDLTDR